MFRGNCETALTDEMVEINRFEPLQVSLQLITQIFVVMNSFESCNYPSSEPSSEPSWSALHQTEKRLKIAIITSTNYNEIVSLNLLPAVGLNARGVILRAFDQFRLKSCIDFKPRGSEEHYISVQKLQGYVLTNHRMVTTTTGFFFTNTNIIITKLFRSHPAWSSIYSTHVYVHVL